MSSADEEAAAAAAWDAELELAIAGRGRTRSRSILATHTSEEDEGDAATASGGGAAAAEEEQPPQQQQQQQQEEEEEGEHGGRRGARRGELEPLQPLEQARRGSVERRSIEMDVVDGGHDPNWLNSPASEDPSFEDPPVMMRYRARSFTANRVQEMERLQGVPGGGGDTMDEAELDAMARDADNRRRSRSFSALNQQADDSGTVRVSDAPDAAQRRKKSEEEERQDVVRRAASLSKIYLVGSSPVDVSKLQDQSKIVGGKKVEVVEPTGALSSQALGVLSEGLQSFSVDKSALLGSGGGVNALGLPVESEDGLLSEAELEEKKMAEEEDKKLRSERISTRRTLSEKASFFKSKVFKSSRALSPPNSTTATVNEEASGGQAAFASGTSVGGSSNSTTSSGASLTRSSSSASTILTPGNGLGPAAPSMPIKRHKLKLLLLGDSGVGKTSLMRVFSGDAFSESMLATAGVDFKLRNIAVGDEEIALQIWDTAGQERFHRITATYYKGANGIVLVYDVSDKKSFSNVGYWMNNIRQYASPNMPAMLLVGNKIDLENRVVSTEEGAATAKQYNVRFIETSAKTSENTNGALETIASDAFLMSVNANVTQKQLMDKEKSRRNKENCVIS